MDKIIALIHSYMKFSLDLYLKRIRRFYWYREYSFGNNRFCADSSCVHNLMASYVCAHVAKNLISRAIALRPVTLAA